MNPWAAIPYISKKLKLNIDDFTIQGACNGGNYWEYLPIWSVALLSNSANKVIIVLSKGGITCSCRREYLFSLIVQNIKNLQIFCIVRKKIEEGTEKCTHVFLHILYKRDFWIFIKKYELYSKYSFSLNLTLKKTYYF